MIYFHILCYYTKSSIAKITELKDTSTGKSYKGGNNCATTPSMHQDDNRCQIIGDIEERPIIPEIVIEMINNLIKTYFLSPFH